MPVCHVLRWKFVNRKKTLAAQLNSGETDKLSRESFTMPVSSAAVTAMAARFGQTSKKLLRTCCTDTTQVVGHTNVEEIRTVSYTDRSMTYADVLTAREQFYEIDI